MLQFDWFVRDSQVFRATSFNIRLYEEWLTTYYLVIIGHLKRVIKVHQSSYCLTWPFLKFGGMMRVKKYIDNNQVENCRATTNQFHSFSTKMKDNIGSKMSMKRWHFPSGLDCPLLKGIQTKVKKNLDFRIWSFKFWVRRLDSFQ